MPQTTALSLWRANYPVLAQSQKPPGLNPPISTTLWGRAVPNKPQWTGTFPASVGTAETYASSELEPPQEEQQGTQIPEEEEFINGEEPPEDQLEDEPPPRNPPPVKRAKHNTKTHGENRDQLDQASDHAEQAQMHAGEAEEEAGEAKEHIAEAKKSKK